MSNTFQWGQVSDVPDEQRVDFGKILNTKGFQPWAMIYQERDGIVLAFCFQSDKLPIEKKFLSVEEARSFANLEAEAFLKFSQLK